MLARQAGKDLVVCGDGRCDSPGCSEGVSGVCTLTLMQLVDHTHPLLCLRGNPAVALTPANGIHSPIMQLVDPTHTHPSVSAWEPSGRFDPCADPC